MDSALTAELVTRQLLEQVAEAWQGRPGVSRLRAATALARTGSESPLESFVRLVIGDHGLPEPALQIAVRAGGRTWRIDLGYPQVGLGIEADGRAFHGTPEALLEDRGRQNALLSAGWLLLRLTWDDVLHRPASVAMAIADALARRSVPAEAFLS